MTLPACTAAWYLNRESPSGWSWFEVLVNSPCGSILSWRIDIIRYQWYEIWIDMSHVYLAIGPAWPHMARHGRSACRVGSCVPEDNHIVQENRGRRRRARQHDNCLLSMTRWCAFVWDCMAYFARWFLLTRAGWTWCKWTQLTCEQSTSHQQTWIIVNPLPSKQLRVHDLGVVLVSRFPPWLIITGAPWLSIDGAYPKMVVPQNHWFPLK